jgi:precorrin-4/cobalt-precorrin-4 C11-methyltransferase
MIHFVGAGPGDPGLITVKGKQLLESADVVLYTGSLIPKKILSWCPPSTQIDSSEQMDYDEIFAYLKRYANTHFVRLHTGDPTLYSTLAKQISFLTHEQIPYQVVPGVTAAFGAAAHAGIEYTIPGISQTLILTRIEGNTPNPESLETLLACRNASLVFYLSIHLLSKLQSTAFTLGYPTHTPCWVIEKATWPEETIYRGTLHDIHMKTSHIQGVALILLGDFLTQRESCESGLYARTGH